MSMYEIGGDKAAGWWLVPYDLPALVKFTLVVAFVCTVCFVSYHLAVQRTWVSVFLNGKRFDLPPAVEVSRA
jgi:hypothetical protein